MELTEAQVTAIAQRVMDNSDTKHIVKVFNEAAASIDEVHYAFMALAIILADMVQMSKYIGIDREDPIYATFIRQIELGSSGLLNLATRAHAGMELANAS